eukprot:TRINITY_DN61868_c0_g1_i1.p1 TRINITY_DN61868_c0_g1~~TRINITY_DN61868_c0_g1_i1.p1  ORF type:complete len:780 (+),score=200.60 TRINITY_DN61868_c0_g1_i1:143-2482(+)
MRIFIHGVDTYLGKALVRELRKAEGGSNRMFGTTIGPLDKAPAIIKRPMQAVSSVGGVPDPAKHKKLVDKMQSCRLVVLDLFTCTEEDLLFAITSLKVDPTADPPKQIGEPLDLDIMFVLISSLMVWAGTEVQAADGCLRDTDFMRRKPISGTKYEQWKRLEDLVLASFNREDSRTKAVIVAPGVLYGEGEQIFGPFFKSAWLGQQDHWILAPGENRVPTVHVRDLARLVRQLGFNYSEQTKEHPYYLAVDQPEGTGLTPAAALKQKIRLAEEALEAARQAAAAAAKPLETDEGSAEEGDLEPADEASGEGSASAAEEDTPTAEEEAAGDEGEAGEEGEGEHEDDGVPVTSWPSSQAELVQGIVDEVSEHYQVKLIEEENIPPLEEDENKQDGPTLEELKEALLLDLCVQPSNIMLGENFAEACDPPGWYSREGLMANLRTVGTEFCKERNLRAMRALIAGPPASGKTTLAKSVAEHFNIPHLELPPRPSALDLEQMLERLSSKVCRYRGYVLDAGVVGFAAVEMLFRIEAPVATEEGEEEEEPPGDEGAEPPEPKMERVINKDLCPEFVIVTQAPEDFCRARFRLSHGADSMDEFKESMTYYNDANKTEGQMSLSSFFQDVASIGVFNLPVAGKDEEDMMESVRIYMEGSQAGRPFNYLKTEEEVAEALLKRIAETKEGVAQAKEAELLRAASEHNEEVDEARKQDLRLKLIAEHEEQQREVQAMPLRDYLLCHMVPSLTEGLIEVCKVLPEDPVDYLASYLEKHASADAAGADRAER